MDLAVIIPCHNEAAHLREQLDALAQQEWDGSWEVIVVDNESTDTTAEIARNHEGLAGRLRVVAATGRLGVAHVRRRGVEATTATAVVFCDGDDVVGPKWVASLGDALRSADFVTGQVEVDRLNPPELAATRGRRRLGQEPRFGEYTILSGGNGGMTREAWNRFGGFDEGFRGLEDIELSLRLAAAGERIEFVPEAVLHYRYREGWRQLWSQGLTYGASRVRLAVRCRELGLNPPPRSGAVRSWAWLLLNTPRAFTRRSRPRWVWTLASRLGAVRAAVAVRTRAFRSVVARSVFLARLAVARRPLLQRRPLHRAPLHLVSVAFDNPTVIRAQLTMLQVCLTDPHSVTVADNSPHVRKRLAIKAICREMNVEYYRVPRNPYTGRDPSRSHAEALHHVCRHLGDLSGVSVIGFLDHDVFPTPGTTVMDRFPEFAAYGRVQQGVDCWYLWPGLMFLALDRFDIRRLDFSPVRGRGDAGCAMYFSHLRSLAPNEVEATHSELVDRESSSARLQFERHDTWLHTVNASYWRAEPAKEAEVLELLGTHGLSVSESGLDQRLSRHRRSN